MSPSDDTVEATRLARRTVLGAGALSLLAVACRDAGAPSAAPEPAATPTVSAGPTTSAKKGKQPTPGTAAVAPVPPVTGRPTADSITLNVVAWTAEPITVDFSPAAGGSTSTVRAVPPAAGAPVEVELTGLARGSSHRFRAQQGDRVLGEGTFVTQRRRGEAFTFTVQGDSHPERVGRQFDAALYERTLRSAAADEPDFHVCIGDDFSVDALKAVTPDAVRALYLQQRRWLSLVGAPLFLVNGNHEQAARANYDGTPDNVAVWAQTSRNALYPQPAPDAFFTGNPEPVEHIGLLRNYFSFSWGDALFVVIDPYWHSPQTVDNQFGVDREETKARDLWNVTLGETQYRWFEQTLRTSDATHKFVFGHHVNGTGRGGVELAKSFEWGDLAQFASRRPGWGRPIHHVMADHGVKIFFQGHDHIYVHQQLDGVVYQTLPEPANPFFTLENSSAYRTGTKVANSGHVRVRVTATGATVEYVRTYPDKADEVAHSYHV